MFGWLACARTCSGLKHEIVDQPHTAVIGGDECQRLQFGRAFQSRRVDDLQAAECDIRGVAHLLRNPARSQSRPACARSCRADRAFDRATPDSSCSPLNSRFQGDSARPTSARWVGTGSMVTGNFMSSTIRLTIITCWDSFSPKWASGFWRIVDVEQLGRHRGHLRRSGSAAKRPPEWCPSGPRSSGSSGHPDSRDTSPPRGREDDVDAVVLRRPAAPAGVSRQRSRSSGDSNCSGLTDSEATTASCAARAACMRAACPPWRAPIVGMSATEDGVAVGGEFGHLRTQHGIGAGDDGLRHVRSQGRSGRSVQAISGLSSAGAEWAVPAGE